MKDTPPEVESFFNELMMKKTGEERLRMGFSMFEMARKQVLASILNQDQMRAQEKSASSSSSAFTEMILLLKNVRRF